MKLLKGKLMIPVILVVVIGAVIGISFVQPGLLPFTLSFSAAQAASLPTPTPQAREAGSGMVFTMKERVLNLKGGEGLRYLKIAIAIEFDTKEDVSKLKGEEYKKMQQEFDLSIAPRVPLLNDAITTVVTAKDASELATAEGKERLRGELKEHFSAFFAEPRIVQVYFTEFVMQ
jgi:flagellar protein FliL